MMERDAASARERRIRASSTLVELVQRRAQAMAERSAYTFLADGDRDEHALSYGALDESARALAAAMQGAPGERALLLVTPGLDFVRAFFGCLYAGLIAVPVPLPSSKRGLPRVLAIARDCRPSVVVSPRRFLASLAESASHELEELRALRTVALDDVSAGDAALYRAPELGASDVAFLQYTSGSTGTPKGVVLTHANLLANERAIASAFGHDEHSVVVGWLPPFHDMGLIGNVLQPMFLGALGVHMAPQHFLAEPLRWLRAISRYRATTSGGPNFAYELCVQKISEAARAELDLTSWRVAFNGAEPVRAATLERFTRAFAESGFSRRAFYPCYGLAEATLLVSGGDAREEPVVAEVDARALEAGRLRVRGGEQAAQSLVGAGMPRDVTLAIVDPSSHAPLGAGEVGEIWVRGAAVAQGYWGRAEESALTFAAHTTAGEGPFLRTGDLGALRDGELFVTGRLKDLIIVRGRNLYPQDLETAAAESCPETRMGGAAAFALEPEGSDSDERIVVVQEVARSPHLNGAAVAAAIRDAVAERFEVALHAVVLIVAGTLPRTTSGKVQRRLTRTRFLEGALHVCFQERGEARAQKLGEPPRTQLERELAAIWEVVLGRAPGTIARDQDFVQSGGDSLAAAQIAVRVSEAAGVELGVAQVFECGTVAKLAEVVARAERAPVHAAPREQAGKHIPLSRVQERLWFFEQLAGGEPVHHVAGAVRMPESIDVAALARAVEALVARHEALRTRFVSDADGVQQRVMPSEPLALTPVQAVGRSLESAVADVVRRPFDLAHEPPVRFRLVRCEGEYALVFVAHHLVVDGWSTALLVRELRALYRAACAGAPLELAPLSARYAEFALAERQREERARSREYWRARFATLPAPLDLPLDRPRGALQSYRGDRLVCDVPAALSAPLTELGRAHDATPFVTWTAAFAAFLGREAAVAEVCLGTPVMIRREAREEGVVGCYLNTLPLRLDLRGQPSFGELLARVRRTVNEAHAHADLPFERILELARAPRELARSPLFQAMIALQPSHELAAEQGAPWKVEQLATGSAQFELSLDLIPGRDGALQIAWEFNRDLFERASIEAMAARFFALVARLLRAPATPVVRLPWLEPSDPRQAPEPAAAAWTPVHVAIERAAAESPDAEALVYGAERLCYGALRERVCGLASALRARGVAAETRVAVYADRSPALVIAVLAVLEAGGAYLALDPRQPLARTTAVLREAEVDLLIASAEHAAVLAGGVEGLRTIALDASARGDERLTGVAPEQLAYLLFTSGSTGAPKGVAVSHAALAHTLAGWRAAYGEDGARPRVLSLASQAFDVWTADWVRALASGGTLVLGEQSLAFDPRALTETLRREAITLVDLVPAQVDALLAVWGDEPPDLPALRLVVVGSDAWSLATLRALRAKLPARCRILSCYGVTEAAIDSAYFEAPRALEATDGTVPLGVAFAGTRLEVLDALGQPVPDGVPGELAIAGQGLARGYVARAALTAERFVPDLRVAGARMYRTGDRVRRDRHGRLHFLGRLDTQLKIRGVRVEPGEIEACLLAYPAVLTACVVVARDERGGAVLTAYVVPREGSELDIAALRSELRARLPEVMQPSEYVVRAALPLSANGKVDRKALAALVLARTEPAAGVAPESALEHKLLAIWGELLPGRELGVQENFFDVGGHSLLLAQVQTRLRAELAREVPILLLLQHPTVRSLATALEGEGGSPSISTAASVRDERVHERRAALLARRSGGSKS